MFKHADATTCAILLTMNEHNTRKIWFSNEDGYKIGMMLIDAFVGRLRDHCISVCAFLSKVYIVNKYGSLGQAISDNGLAKV